MASLTGNTIQSTYDSLLKVTDNDSITGSLKRITDGLGNNTPLYLSSSAVEIVSTLNVTSTITASNLSGTNTGDETKASIETKLGAATSSNSGYLTSTDWSTFNNKIAGTGTLNKLAKFSSSSSIADSTITDTGSAVTIGVATSVTGSLTASSLIRTGGTSSQFLKADGSVDSTSYQPILTNPVTGTGTTNTLPKFTGTSTIGNSNISDSGTLITLTGNSYVNGNLGVGTTSLTQYGLRVSRDVTGSAQSVGISSDGTILSGVTSAARLMQTVSYTTAAAFTLADLYHFGSYQGSIGAGSTVTRQHGFYADSSLIGAANNYGFYGNIPSGANRWNLYMNGTANNYLAGSLGIGTTTLTGYTVAIGKSITGAGTSIGVYQTGTVQSDVTSSAFGFRNDLNTQAATFTLPVYTHYAANQSTIGAGTTLTTQIGFSAGTFTGGANVFGFRGQVAAASGRYNLYMDGTAQNYFAGNVGIGTTSPVVRLHVETTGTGTTTFSNTITTFRSQASGRDILLQFSDTANQAYIGSLSGNIYFGTGGATERMRITPGGNVGIGTTSPSSLLDVNGQSIFRGQGSASSGTINLISSDSFIRLNTTGGATDKQKWDIRAISATGFEALEFRTVNDANNSFNTRMWLSHAGNVGIGTTSPGYKLDVAGSINVAANAYHYIGGNKAFAGSGSDFLYFFTGTTALTVRNNADTSELVRITNGGNVGIGTSSPNEKLSVIGAISANNGMIVQGYSAAASGLNAEMGVTAGYVQFNAYNRSTSAYGSFRLDGSNIILNAGSGGNVGIGTSSPGALLTVNGTPLSTSGAIISIRDTSATGTGNYFGGIFFNSSPGTDFAIGKVSESGTASLGFRNGNTGAEYMRINSAGNVGINTTSPSYKLDVNGDIRSTGAIRVNTGTIDTALTFDTSAGAVGTVTNHNLNFWINGTTQAKLTTDAQLYVGTGIVSSSAKVQIDSTTKGFLPPRMTSLQRIAIASPAVGLMVYQTDNAGGLGGNEGLYIYKSGGWTFII